MYPQPGEVLHFSEDPTIARFVPHVAATADEPDPLVWAVDASRAPDYWFPRECPRALAWLEPETCEDDVRWLGADRVHAIEQDWLEAMHTVAVYAYRLPAERFRPFGHAAHALVSPEPVVPLGPPLPLGDLVALHARAGVELRAVDSLWPFVDRAANSTLGYSGIRLHNARPRTSTPSPPGG